MLRTLLLIAMMLSAQAAALPVCECQLSEHFSHKMTDQRVSCLACSELLQVGNCEPGDDHEHHHCDCQSPVQPFTETLAHMGDDRPSMPMDRSFYSGHHLDVLDGDRKSLQHSVDSLDRRHAARVLIELWLL